MKISKPVKIILAFIIIIIIALAAILILLRINKPYNITAYTNDLNTFTSGNYNLKFNYPKELGNPAVKFPEPVEFENENITFNNGLSISYFRFEGFYGPYQTTEENYTKDKKNCTINTFTQGFTEEFTGIIAQCFAQSEGSKSVTFIWQNISSSQLENNLSLIKSIIASLEFNSDIKLF